MGLVTALVTLALLAALAPGASAEAPMPGLKATGPVPATQIVEPAWWTPMATVARDCGFSVPLSDGSALWIFCDSTNADANGNGLTYFINNTAALAFPAQPTVMREPWDPATGAPYQFIDPATAGYHPCVAGERHVVWPIAATRSGGYPNVDRIVIYYENICQNVATLANRTMSTGVAEWLYGYTQSEAQKLAGPIRANIVNPQVLNRPAGVTPWGVGAVDGRDGYLYLNRCTNGGCSVARVPFDQFGTTAAYSFWTGSGWSAGQPANVGQVQFLGGGVYSATHVQWVGALGAFIMTAWKPGSGAEVVAFASSRPYGPWTAPIEVPMTGCARRPNGFDGCYHAVVHSHLSGPGSLAVGIHDAYQIRGGRATTGGLLTNVPVNTGSLAGRLESVTSPQKGRLQVTGWGEDPNRPAGGLPIHIYANGAYLGSTTGGIQRNDIKAAYPGWTGKAGFSATFDSPLGNVRACAFGIRTGPGGNPQLGCRDVWVPDPASPFLDVLSRDTFFGDIVWLDENGITGGYADGTFRQNGSVRRDAMAAFLYRMAGSPPFTPPATSPFSDVPTNRLFYKEITWLASTGVTTGYGDGRFGPNDVVGRGPMAAFLYRLAGSPPHTPPATSPFSDVPVNHVFYGPVTWLASTGVTTGYPDGRFKPGASVLRGSMAAFLHRYDTAGLPILPT